MDPVLLTAGAAVLFGAILCGVGSLFGVAPPIVLQDPAVRFQFPAYAGILSYLGIGFLIATVAVAGLAASLVARGRGVLIGAAILSAILAADDLLVLHERIGPEDLGIPQNAFFVAYALAAMGLLICVRREGYPLGGLLICVGFLAVSVLSDLVPLRGPVMLLVEDLSKLGGFAAWMAFWICRARAGIRDGIGGGVTAARPSPRRW